MYRGFGSRLNGSTGARASIRMRPRSSVNRRAGAGGKGPWNKGYRGGSMRRGRSRGSHSLQQPIKVPEISSSAIRPNEEKNYPIKEEPGVEIEKLSNSGRSNQNSAGSVNNVQRPLLHTHIKEEPGVETMMEPHDSDRYGDGGTDPGPSECIQDESDVDKNEGNSSALVPVQPSSSSVIQKSGDNVGTADETPKPVFVCYDCDVTCTSDVSFQEHLAGKKHKAQQAVKREKNATTAAIKNKTQMKPVQSFGSSKVGILRKSIPLPGSSMQSVLRMLCGKEDVVGMQYVTEYRKLGTTQYRYMCELCDNICNMNEMVEHLVTRKHRMRYARLHLFRAYARMTDYPSFSNMMLPTQLDNFLARLCARVVYADVAGGMRPLRAKQYINESDICIDVGVFSSIGKQPPSMIEDLIIAENILEEADSIRQGSRIQPPNLMGLSSGTRGNLRTKLSEFDQADTMVKKSPLIPKPKLHQSGTAVVFLEKKKKSILQSLEANSRSIKLYGLTVTSAKERDSLLKHLNATNSKLKELRGIDQQASQFDSEYQEEDNPSTVVNRLPNRRRDHSDYEEIPSKRIKDETSQSASLSDPLVEIQKAVEPIIAETRRRVEQKIFEAMESGNLSSVLNALKNNPNLHETLQKWEEGQKTQEDAGPSHRRPGNIEDDEYRELSGPPQRRPELAKGRGQSEHAEDCSSASPRNLPRLFESHGYPEYSDTGRPQRRPGHTEGHGYAKYSEAVPLQRRLGQIAGRVYPDYSEATPSQRRPARNDGSRYPRYCDEANVNEDFFDEYNLSTSSIDQAVEPRPPIGLRHVRRRGLLGTRPSFGMNTASLRHRRYNDAGW